MPSKSPPKPFTPTQEKIIDFVVKPMSRLNTWLYRLTAGKVGGRWTYGAPVMLLTMTGRKSGEQRTTPLLYLRDGDLVVTVASKGGSARHPKWFLNLLANPMCEVEIGSERKRMRARQATAAEKQKYWPKLVALYPDYDMYQQRTARDIPVVILTPAL
jgi:deazaflavin-dependent oxidoreductase (nitroreductase family)